MNLNTRIFHDINDFARDTPWLHPIVSGYAAYGVVLFAACNALHDIVVLHCDTDAGFPSDHAVMARTPPRVLLTSSATEPVATQR